MIRPAVESSNFHPFTLRSTPYRSWKIIKFFMKTSDPTASLEAVLDQIPLFPKLSTALGETFMVTASKGRLHDYPPSGGDVICTKPENGVALIRYLNGIMDQKVRGYEKSASWDSPSWPGRSSCKASSVCVQAILLILSSGEYLGSFLKIPLTKYVHITPLHLAWNSSLLRFSQE